MKLVIVESPSKAKTIGKYLGRSYKVLACKGHLRDLPKSKLGVDIENNFEPSYINVRGKAKDINELKKAAKASDKVFLATDPDREGEAISWHLSQILDVEQDKLTRIAFNEITKTAVKNAVDNARGIDMSLVDAQQARRVLDRVVGYQISPLLWKKVKKGLSAGRVQSVATYMIVERQREIDAFEPEEYWTLDANLTNSKNKDFIAKFYGTDTKQKIENEEQAKAIEDTVKNADFIVKSVEKKEKKRNPSAPFTTSTLQQEASRKLNFQSRKTMQVAQKLYEHGYITYMRTDSLRLSNDSLDEIRNYIKTIYGDSYLPETPRIYKSKKAAQDAHEAIRPSHFEEAPISLKGKLDKDEYKLYSLIWNRTIACQMEQAIFDTVTASIWANDYQFRANGQAIKFAGFMKVYIEGQDTEEEKAGILPELNEEEKVNLLNLVKEQHYTQPPANFTEATLIKAMEENGIGRPSTYAPTIATILARGYVSREQKKLYPTELGILVTGLMEEYFKNIIDVNFTAKMEDELDEVAEKGREWKSVLNNFYPDFKVCLDKAEAELEKVEIKDEVSDIACDKCGRMMVYKLGRYGKFLACPGFPECRNIKSIVKEAGVECPLCGGQVVEKKSKRGKIFYGCENYPECKMTTWDKPTGKKCETCGSPIVEKTTKTKGTVVFCSNSECEKAKY